MRCSLACEGNLPYNNHPLIVDISDPKQPDRHPKAQSHANPHSSTLHLIGGGFLDPEARSDLIELTRDGSVAHRWRGEPMPCCCGPSHVPLVASAYRGTRQALRPCPADAACRGNPLPAVGTDRAGTRHAQSRSIRRRRTDYCSADENHGRPRCDAEKLGVSTPKQIMSVSEQADSPVETSTHALNPPHITLGKHGTFQRVCPETANTGPRYPRSGH